MPKPQRICLFAVVLMAISLRDGLRAASQGGCACRSPQTAGRRVLSFIKEQQALPLATINSTEGFVNNHQSSLLPKLNKPTLKGKWLCRCRSAISTVAERTAQSLANFQQFGSAVSFH